MEEYLQKYREQQQLTTMNKNTASFVSKFQETQTNQGKNKKYLSCNDDVFMQCFQCTVLPSPPNIPIQESVKFQNYSERDRYYKIATELQKIKKIIINDKTNEEYYAKTVKIKAH